MERTEPQWALTLSGGGLRATLFHLGVVRRLWREGDLQNVRAIFSVSGGSILAAHLHLHWTKYTGSEEAFDQAARDVLELCGRDLRGRVVRRTIFCWLAVIPVVSRLFSHLPAFVPGSSALRWWAVEVWPSAWLVKEYDRFYGKAELRRFNPVFNGTEGVTPRLSILSTSLSTGELCVFQDHTFVVRKRNGGTVELPAENAPVALAVASSSAYPALFSPILVNAPLLLAPPDRLPEDHYLSDGGLFDNLGVEELEYLIEGGRTFDRVIVSDAGAAMTVDLNRQPWGFFKRAIRTTDVIMTRAADGVLGKLRGNPRYTMVRIHDTFDDRGVSRNTQMTIGAVRTDLDAFSAHERNLIANHGFQVAGHQLYARGQGPLDQPEGSAFWYPESDTRRGPLTGSNVIRWSRLFRWQDWCTWANVLLALVWVYSAVYFAYLFSGTLRSAYLQHEHEHFIQVCDAAGRQFPSQVDLMSLLPEFWEQDRPGGLGALPVAFRLHRVTALNNRLCQTAGLSRPFPPLRERISASNEESGSIGMLHRLGDIWRADQPERYEQLRDDTYLRVLRITDDIVKRKVRDARAEALIREFFVLYWGRMAALESRFGVAENEHSSVESRMEGFGDVLLAWTSGGPRPTRANPAIGSVDVLAELRDELRYRMFEELRVLRQ